MNQPTESRKGGKGQKRSDRASKGAGRVDETNTRADSAAPQRRDQTVGKFRLRIQSRDQGR